MKSIQKKAFSPVAVAVGQRIKAIILDKEMRQRDLAHDAGLDVENLRKYTKGSQEMKRPRQSSLTNRNIIIGVPSSNKKTNIIIR